MTSFGFDVGNTKPQLAFDPIKDGWYAMRIANAETCESKSPEAGTGIKITFEIMESVHPELSGRRVFLRLYHQHKTNKQTRDIARAQIAAIAHAIGRPTASNTDDFLGTELRVKVKAKPADGQYEASNDVKGFKGLNEAVDEAAPAAAAAGAPAATSSGTPKTSPWKR